MYSKWRLSTYLALVAVVGILPIKQWPLNRVAEADPSSAFTRGDVDGDRRFLISDAVNVFRYLFLADSAVDSCEDAADVDDDGAITITDGIYLLNYLFQRGVQPPPPFPTCGEDSTEDALGCEQFEMCDTGTFTFYGHEFRGKGVFFVVDHSGSMNDSGELQKAKMEISRALETLSGAMQFGIVFFDMNVKHFPSSGRPVSATPEMKTSALSFLNAIGRGTSSCMAKGLRAALQFVAQIGSGCVVIYIGDGGGTCAGEGGGEAGYLRQMVAEITAQNVTRAQIHCFGVLMNGRTMQESYMRQLAAANDGGYWRLERSSLIAP